MTTKKLGREKVAAALLKTLAKVPTEKLCGGLKGKHDKKTCYCIEGLFLETALDLGVLTGAWRYTNDEIEEFNCFDSSGCSYSANAPQVVFDLLGIPNTVPWELMVTEAGLKDQAIEQDFYVGKSVEWWVLNDLTALSLKQLVDYAIQLLQKK